MNTQVTIGRVLFSIAMTGLAILCFINLDFIVGRPPKWPDGIALNPALAYVSATIIIAASIAILIAQFGYLASLAIASLILFLSISRHIPNFAVDYGNALKTFALLGGAFIIAASFDGRRAKPLITMGIIFIAAFFLACGYLHVNFYDFVKEYIPAFIPFRGFFTYFSAACLVAGGIGILIPATQKLAALLSGIMLVGFFLLVHIPHLIANPQDVGERMGLFESLGLAGVLFVLAVIGRKRKAVN